MDYPTLNLVTTLLPVLTLIPGVIELIAQWASNKRVSRWCPLVLSVAHFPLLFVAPTFIGDTLAGDIPRIASSYGAPESSLEILGVIGVIGIQASIIRSQKRKICDAFDAEPATGPSVAPARPPDQLDARDIEDHDRVLREWIASGKPGGEETISLIEGASSASDAEGYAVAVRRLTEHWDTDLNRRLETMEDAEE